MTSFAAPFPPGQPAPTELRLALPDPPRVADQPIVRIGVARYAGATLSLMRVASFTTPGSFFSLHAPTTGAARQIALAANPGNDPGVSTLLGLGISDLLEISPLPFAIADVLAELRGGLPTFYIGYPINSLIGTNKVPEDALLTIGDPLASVDVAFVGVLFQDRATLAPRTWIELIGAAMARANQPLAEIDGWNGMLASLATGTTRRVRVLDHAGRPLAGREFRIDLPPTGATLTTDGNGDLFLPDLASNISIAPIGSQFPLLAIYETGDSSNPESATAILLPDAPQSTLQVSDAALWFAPRSAGIPTQRFQRFYSGSRIEPLIDGILTYQRLVEDLRASAAPNCGAHLAGWVFQDFALLEGEPDSSIIEIVKQIDAGGGSVRLLVNDLLQVNIAAGDQLAQEVAATAIVLSGVLLMVELPTTKNGAGLFAFLLTLGAVAGAGSAIESITPMALLLKLLEENEAFLTAINSIDGVRSNRAVRTSYPATVDDNPSGHDQLVHLSIPPGVVDFAPVCNQFGTYHQKIHAIRRGSVDSAGNEFVAYVGGVDLDRSRLDDPGHNGRATLDPEDAVALNRLVVAPFHDVHARVSGRAAANIFATFEDRYAFELTVAQSRFFSDRDRLPLAFPTPDANALPGSGPHVMQIGRTYYGFQGHPSALSFAPEGETTTNRTLISAIGAAREYIYIEDQYFTPNAREGQLLPSGPDTYFDALMAAADNCQRLAILVPLETDQLFGDQRRRFLFDRLRLAWGDRLLIGVPLRRPFLENAGRIASRGRCVLAEEVEANALTIRLFPTARVPVATPYWLWIGGELMLAFQVVPLAGGEVVEVSVERASPGSNPRWGATPRAHRKFAPVTMAQISGIYVHSKVTTIDDTFVAIGSSNANRRGYLHDGEIHAFAVPQQLKAAVDNPARALRTALWAEHLGLPPSMGTPLLDDPIAAFELLRRSPFEGNRYTRFDALDVQAQFDLSVSLTSLLLAPLGLAIGVQEVRTLWDDATDPTSFSDPQPRSGPIPEGP